MQPLAACSATFATVCELISETTAAQMSCGCWSAWNLCCSPSCGAMTRSLLGMS